MTRRCGDHEPRAREKEEPQIIGQVDHEGYRRVPHERVQKPPGIGAKMQPAVQPHECFIPGEGMDGRDIGLEIERRLLEHHDNGHEKCEIEQPRRIQKGLSDIARQLLENASLKARPGMGNQFQRRKDKGDEDEQRHYEKAQKPGREPRHGRGAGRFQRPCHDHLAQDEQPAQGNQRPVRRKGDPQDARQPAQSRGQPPACGPDIPAFHCRHGHACHPNPSLHRRYAS